MTSLQLDPSLLLLDGRPVAVRVRRSSRAKRMILRIVHDEEALLLTLPTGVTREAGLDFVRRQQTWIQQRLSKLPDRVPFAEGAKLPLLGEEHEIRHAPEERRGVWREAGCLWVSGKAEHLPRVSDCLREARKLLRTEPGKWALPAGAVPCGGGRARHEQPLGKLLLPGQPELSWRLIFAPEPVFDMLSRTGRPPRI